MTRQLDLGQAVTPIGGERDGREVRYVQVGIYIYIYI